MIQIDYSTCTEISTKIN